MNDVQTAHKMLDMCQQECNILTNLRQILLAANMNIPSSHVHTTRQRYITLCIQLDKFNQLWMSYPLLAVLSVVDLLRHWHMKHDSECSQASSSQTWNWHTASYRYHTSSDVCNICTYFFYIKRSIVCMFCSRLVSFFLYYFTSTKSMHHCNIFVTVTTASPPYFRAMPHHERKYLQLHQHFDTAHW